MTRFATLLCAACIVIAAAAVCYADSAGRIYGTITTVDGDTYTGLVRWDRNEGSWFDVLNGDKEIRRGERRRERERIRVFGITIGERLGTGDSGSAQSGLSFGHIKSLEPVGDQEVRLYLKGGEKTILSGGSSDIGEEIREIVIEDAKEGEIGLDWDDIERIDFAQAPQGIESTFGDRMYGTLVTRRGDEYTGWVSWDIDELFSKDILDGEERGRDRKVPLGELASIERRSSSGAELVFLDGDRMVLRETNDVDESNRGITVYDPGIGQATVSWDEFDRLDFKRPPAALRYDDFDGGRLLEGTVYTEDGESYTGRIRWDDDERWTWEILDGECRDAELDVAFAGIREIKRQGSRGAIVTTRDGRTFRLSGTNDVNDGNRGIFVESEKGRDVEIDWDELDRVEFEK